MKIIGIIAEYNPFHNGHIYHLNKIKRLYPNSLIILVLNGYFLERGEISLLSKEDKTKIALKFNIDIVLELPAIFGTQAADIFAEKAIAILNHLQVNEIIFGSESNDLEMLLKIAQKQLNPEFNNNLKKVLKTGINYPTALSKALNLKEIIKEPNDLLAISYAKAILKNNYPITLHPIKRTNNYHDLKSTKKIVSASNIRNKLKNKENIKNYVPKEVYPLLKKINEELLWNLIKYKIMTENDLSKYLTVDEGIEKRLKKMLIKSNNLDEYINNIKTKRYTYNKIKRMLFHILIGLTKSINDYENLEYIRILGFNKKGQKYLNSIKKEIEIALKPNFTSKTYQFELRTSYLYDMLTNANTISFEKTNKPITFLHKI